MKLIRKKKKKKTSSSSARPDVGASWSVTDPSLFGALATSAKNSGNRPPEFWVKDGETQQIRFLDEGAVVSFRVYRLKVSGRWQRYVQPVPGDANLFESDLAQRPQQVFVFRVIDIAGYTPKNGKPQSNIPRFFVVGARVFEQINMLGKEMTLNSRNVKVSRSGSGTDTTYQFMPNLKSSGRVMTPEMKRAATKFPKWQDHYIPTTVEEQRAVVAATGGFVDNNG